MGQYAISSGNVGLDYVGAGAQFGQLTTDYGGSRQEWEQAVAEELIRRYTSGEGGSGWADPSFSTAYGKPSASDFGSGGYGPQTEQFIMNFVRSGDAAKSNWVTQNFGQAPTQNATFTQDPNSPSALQGTWEQRSSWESGEAAKDRAHEAAMAAADRASREAMAAADNAARMAQIASNERIAGMQEAGATQRVSMQIRSNEKIATMEDATRRYIAEGDWGVQKWVTTENNTAAMARLEKELGFRREELAQRAIEEKNRHHTNMVGLALEVAKYDSELAASPRNWMAYAAWLQNRNIVVNGMTLAMAAQEVPEAAIDPSEVAAMGDNVGAITQMEALTTGQSGGNAQPVTPEMLQQILATNTGAPSGTTAQQAAGGALPQHTPSPSAQDLANTTDYAGLANQLLGMNPLAPNQADTSTQNLQSLANSLSTTGGRVAGFGAYGGPRTNALGVTVPEVSGQDVDYRQFANMLDSEQQAKIGMVESVRGPAGGTDFIKEMELSRPKGRTTSVGFG